MVEQSDDAWDVFVSYATEDRTRARAVFDACEASGARCFFDEVAFGKPRSVSAALSDHLARSRVLIVVWSQSAAHSPWVELELAAFLGLPDPERRVVALAIDDEPLPKIHHVVDDVERAVDRALCPAAVFVNYDPANLAAAQLCDALEGYGHLVDRLREGDDLEAWRRFEQFDRPLIICFSGADQNPPSAWEKHFDRNRAADRVMVVRSENISTPPILARAARLEVADAGRISEWLEAPPQLRLGDIFRAPAAFWGALAQQLPSRPGAHFGFADLSPDDLRSRAHVLAAKIFAIALSIALLLFAASFFAAPRLPLLDPQLTQRHLLMNAAAVLLAASFLGLARSAAAGATGAVIGAVLGCAATLLSGLYVRPGAIGGAVTAGALLGAAAATYANLPNPKIASRAPIYEISLKLAEATFYLALPMLLGGVLVRNYSYLHEAPAPERILFGTTLGGIAGLSFGLVVFLVKFRRNRERLWKRAAQTALRTAILSAALGGTGFLLAPGAVEQLGNGYAIGLFIGILIAGCFSLPQLMLERSLGAHRSALTALLLSFGTVCTILPFFPNVAQKAELLTALAGSIALGYLLARSAVALRKL